MHKKIEILVFCLIIYKIVFTGILTTISAYCEFYEYELPKVYHYLKSNNVFDRFFSTYTGLDTGYGFFAPNVSSSFIVVAEGEEQSFLSTDLLTTTEGRSRFSNLNDIFFNNIDKDTSLVKVNNIVLNIINDKFENVNKQKFKTTVYLYEYPMLKNVQNNEPKLIKISENQR